MKIYTKTGDAGETGLLGGGRVAKDDPRIEAIGDVDELNAALGVARVVAAEDLERRLFDIQSRLFDLGAELAAPEGHALAASEQIAQSDIEALERSIDAMTERLEPLRNFILPGGTTLASALHFARAVCRRAERRLLRLHRIAPMRAEVSVFLNRLSDWLFVAARTANAEQGVEDLKWTRREDSRS